MATDTTAPVTTARARHPLFSATIGLAALAVLLQGLWAGLFLPGGSGTWQEVHARGADVAIFLAALATVAAFVKIRERRDLWLGSGVFTLVLLLEAWLGGLVSDGATWVTAIHIPLAMLLMALAVWLPFRATVARVPGESKA